MSKEFVTDVGENYEYIRTIIDNKIEIAKIDFSISFSKIVGYIFLLFLLFGIFGLFISSLLLALAIVLGKVIGSIVIGIILTSVILAFIAAIIYSLRKSLIFTPVAKLFYRIIADKE